MVRASEQLKLDILMKVLSGKLSRSQAQKLLNVSKSTMKRYLKKYHAKGAQSIKHGNSYRKPIHTYDVDLKNQVKDLLVRKYFDFNVTHFHEKLLAEENLKVDRETLRKCCHEFHMVKRAKRRRGKARMYRDRLPQEGLMLQMDGSHHKWFGEKKFVLIATIDDATNKIPYAEFFVKRRLSPHGERDQL